MKAIVVVHQMGKVGSSSLFNALDSIEHIEAYQTHNLVGRQSVERLHERHAHHVQHELIPGGRSLRFISGVRDPMARNISAFFHNYTENVKTVDEAIEGFLARAEAEISVTQHWFDQQVKSVLGLDVFAKKADFTHGGYVAGGNFLILRLEDPTYVKEQAVARFLDLDGFSLPEINVGSQKPYARLYAEFKEKFRPPRSLVETTFDCKYVRHFYPESHESMKNKWLERSV